jgi:secreted trypsin-like serine protease
LVSASLCAAGGITAGEICVGNVNGTDGACFGDSGSPALQQVTANRWQVVGGASRETVPFCGTAPSIYTDLTYYRDWMYQVMRTGVVPPRVEGSQPAPALVKVNGERWLCRSDVALCS